MSLFGQLSNLVLVLAIYSWSGHYVHLLVLAVLPVLTAIKRAFIVLVYVKFYQLIEQY